jgi:hypothetical protein
MLKKLKNKGKKTWNRLDLMLKRRRRGQQRGKLMKRNKLKNKGKKTWNRLDLMLKRRRRGQQRGKLMKRNKLNYKELPMQRKQQEKQQLNKQQQRGRELNWPKKLRQMKKEQPLMLN